MGGGRSRDGCVRHGGCILGVRGSMQSVCERERERALLDELMEEYLRLRLLIESAGCLGRLAASLLLFFFAIAS